MIEPPLEAWLKRIELNKHLPIFNAFHITKIHHLKNISEDQIWKLTLNDQEKKNLLAAI